MKRVSTKYLQMAAYILLTAILVLIIGVVRDCSRLPSVPMTGHSGGDTLDIALIYGPGSYYLYGDTLGGINLEIAREFQNQTGSPVKLWPVTEPAEALSLLEEGAFDVVASLPLDNAIKQKFLVSESIFLDRLVLVQYSDSTGETPLIKSSLELDGKRVAVAAGSSAAHRMNNLAREIGGDITVEEVPELSDELITLKVASGALPLAVVNERVAKEVAKNYPALLYDNNISFTQFQVWAFNPSDSLDYSKFEKWFDNFRNTENYRRIIEGY